MQQLPAQAMLARLRVVVLGVLRRVALRVQLAMVRPSARSNAPQLGFARQTLRGGCQE